MSQMLMETEDGGQALGWHRAGITGGCQLTRGEAGHRHDQVRAVRPAQQVGEGLLLRQGSPGSWA